MKIHFFFINITYFFVCGRRSERKFQFFYYYFTSFLYIEILSAVYHGINKREGDGSSYLIVDQTTNPCVTTIRRYNVDILLGN